MSTRSLIITEGQTQLAQNILEQIVQEKIDFPAQFQGSKFNILFTTRHEEDGHRIEQRLKSLLPKDYQFFDEINICHDILNLEKKESINKFVSNIGPGKKHEIESLDLLVLIPPYLNMVPALTAIEEKKEKKGGVFHDVFKGNYYGIKMLTEKLLPFLEKQQEFPELIHMKRVIIVTDTTSYDEEETFKSKEGNLDDLESFMKKLVRDKAELAKYDPLSLSHEFIRALCKVWHDPFLHKSFVSLFRVAPKGSDFNDKDLADNILWSAFSNQLEGFSGRCFVNREVIGEL